MGHLILVPTPVGNLGDITLRALQVLKEVDIILAEDTRTTGNLLRHYGINNSLRAFHLHNEHRMLESTLDLITNAEKVALVSDAGTPGISDPGFLLVRACIERGMKVECLPGATAMIPALVESGFPSDRFCFEGFLPHKKGRMTRIKAIAGEKRTTIIYESPYRLVKLLEELANIIGNERKAAVVREISKIHEEVRRGNLSELASHFKKTGVKGEIVVILEQTDQIVDSSEGLAKRNKE